MKHHSKITPPKHGQDARPDQSVLSRIAALKAMSVKELKAEWEKLIGTSAPNNSRAFLEFRIAYRIQELAYGGPDRDTRRMLDLLADEVEGHARRKHQIADPRNPVAGTKLLREWDGVEHTVAAHGGGGGAWRQASSQPFRNWLTPLDWRNATSVASYGWPIWRRRC